MKKSYETLEQIAFFDYLKLAKKELVPYVMHIPNEGKRNVWIGKQLKDMGMRPGVSDIFAAVPRGTYHGLWIELKAKRADGRYGKATIEQLIFIDDMLHQGYQAKVCNGCDEAIRVLLEYLGGAPF